MRLPTCPQTGNNANREPPGGVSVTQQLALTRFDAARVALAEAVSVDEVKDIRDRAEALRCYMKQAGEGLEMQNDVAEIKLRAERRAGELLGEMDLRTGFHDGTLPLPDGITRTQSHRWQAEASMPEDIFENFLADTRERRGEITSVGLYRIAKEQRREAGREQNRQIVAGTLPIETLTAHPTIVIDPPWDWGDEGDIDQLGRARPTYATMTLDDLLALPVMELAQPNAHIYLWITNRSLPKGFALLEAWGFRYVTALTWCKPHFGMGNYFRGSTEHVLFGVRGSLSLLRQDAGTWFHAPRPGVHSAKPDEFYRLVEACSPGPWLEMFARAERPGWTAWGAEV